MVIECKSIGYYCLSWACDVGSCDWGDSAQQTKKDSVIFYIDISAGRIRHYWLDDPNELGLTHAYESIITRDEWNYSRRICTIFYATKQLISCIRSSILHKGLDSSNRMGQ